MSKIALLSLGCAKNRVDSERLLGGFAAHGFSIVENIEEAEAVIITTCGFIRDAAEESIDEILAAARLKESGKCKALVVAGCLVNRYPDIVEEIPEVDYFFKLDEFSKIPGILAERLKINAAKTPDKAIHPRRILTQQNFSAYLKIADGCSNRCSFCTIPAIRGAFRSVAETDLIEEAKQLAEAGVVELNLVAQDSTSYGRDLDDPNALAKLLRELEKIDGIEWIRLLYAYPRPFPPEVVEMLADGGKITPYVDVPIQHIHPRILEKMHRKSSAGEVKELLFDLQARIPGLALRTTVIVGFPGETDDEFQTLVDFIEEVRFHHLGAFIYSAEQGTPAEKLRPRVSKEKASSRLDFIMSTQADISAERNREYLGKRIDVLVEGVEQDGAVRGRCRTQAPEVDGCTYVWGVAPADVKPGSIIRAKVVETWEYDLSAEVV